MLLELDIDVVDRDESDELEIEESELRDESELRELNELRLNENDELGLEKLLDDDETEDEEKSRPVIF
jgi:hypothetical protein